MRSILCVMLLCCFAIFNFGCQKSKEPDKPQQTVRLQETRPAQRPDSQEIVFPDAPPTHTVQVVGNIQGVDYSTWQNTGLSLKKGDTLYIQAEGQVQYVGTSTMSPDGRGNTFYPSLLSDISFMSLVGRVHFSLLDDGIDSSGRGLYGPGFVGSAFKMDYDGRGGYGVTGDNVLYLAVNDSMDNDNDYAFTARIWIVNDGIVMPFEERKTENLLK